ncbi:MAG: 4Fe-4S dicluster domain-containing protein [Chloroflexi bacterium]|nr:4Fe-4S dicluster domain-containing protein [Chloroflexota bacterium]
MARIVEIDYRKCVHCQDCIGVCPVGVYKFVGKRVRVVDPKSCLGPSCQMCADACWKMAITVESGSPDPALATGAGAEGH